MNPFQETAAIFNRAIDQAAKPLETVIERASRVMAENQREIERLTQDNAQLVNMISARNQELTDSTAHCADLSRDLAEAKRYYAWAKAMLPTALSAPFEFDVLYRAEQPFGPDPYPAEYTTKTASPDIVLDCVNALLEKHDDELVEMVREAQLKAWER
jgi:hypothetical protein